MPILSNGCGHEESDLLQRERNMENLHVNTQNKKAAKQLFRGF